MSEVTRILSQIESGSPQAAAQLLPLVYDELRKLAAAKLAHEKPGQTLQATALVHEAWLQLVGDDAGGASQDVGRKDASSRWSGRGHFYAAAAEAMRRILIQSARRRKSQKRGGQWERIELDPALLPAAQRSDKLLALDEALERLEREHPDKAQLVKLRFFAGLTIHEAAALLGFSTTTADRHWAFTRAWLQREMAAESVETGHSSPKHDF
jgi:RNA polymerase sigma factor (TIGR02999 family)